MFVRYLGGGTGHLEQFLPANNNDDAATCEDVEEVDNSNFIGGPKHVDAASEEDDSDLGENSDEETGNVY